MKSQLDKMKSDVAASITADLAAAGLSAGPLAAALAGSAVDEDRATEALKEALDLPQVDLPDDLNESKAPAAEMTPEKMKDSLNEMKKKARAELAATLEAMGQKDSPILDALFPETPEAEKAAQEKMAQDIQAEQQKMGGPPPPTLG
jgi:hypothetical protein